MARKVNKITALSQSPIVSDDEHEDGRMFSEASIPQFYANINHHRIETQDFPQTNEHSAVDAEVDNEAVGQEDSFQN